jgi:hypothetical protein
MSASATEPDTPDSADPNLLTRQPLVWLLVILVLALGLRASKLNDPLHRDEFAALYAVAQRKTAGPDVPPSSSDPLVPVDNLSEVSDRSVLPLGIRNPLPLYHDSLYFTIRVLPISEWSLRLPSLIAGLGCVAAVYFLCRRMAGVEMAVVAALFTAMEPAQVTLGALARPFALGNLACVLSFAALLRILGASDWRKASLPALGYGAATAFMGYMNPVLLLVVAAHVGVIVYWVIVHGKRIAQIAPAIVAVVFAALLLAPEFGYFSRVHEASVAHRGSLNRFYPMELRGFLIHNATFLVGLLAAGVAGFVSRLQFQGEEVATGEVQKEGTTTEQDAILAYAASRGQEAAAATVAKAAESPKESGEPAPPENPDVVWLGRSWLLLPQLVAMMIAYAGSEPIFYSRFLSYTTLGGLLILAYLVTRLPGYQARLGSAAATAAAMFALGLTSWGHGYRLTTPSFSKSIVEQMNKSENVRPGDMILLRPNLPAGDFLPDVRDETERRRLADALAAPFTTLYVPDKPLSIVVLSRSNRSMRPLEKDSGVEARAETAVSESFEPDKFYTPELAARLRAHPGQFWIVTEDLSDHRAYLTCLLPWLADALGSDLKVARTRPGGEHYLTVPVKTKPTDWVDGLSDAKPRDFIGWIRVQRQPVAGDW